jgi:ABC-2 type transport system ATP-binding protein
MNVISIKNVSKRFRERGEWFYVLRDVSLEIKAGEIFGLVGPNGAGKTTLLNILIGMLTPDAGEVRVFGKDITRNRELMDRINYVSGETRFHWFLRVSDILNFYARAYDVPAGERSKRIQEMMRFFDIDKIKHRGFDSLSTGEKMRLVFAKAMLNKPRLLLLDEPTLGLDPDMAAKLRREIKRINKRENVTILLTSHYMHEVEQLCSRMAFINMGEIVDMGSVDEVKLSGFSTYDVLIKVRKILDRLFLLRNGFKVSGKNISKTMLYDETLSDVLYSLSKHGFEILDIHTRKPTLEDYFIKAVKGGRKGERK